MIFSGKKKSVASNRPEAAQTQVRTNFQPSSPVPAPDTGKPTPQSVKKKQTNRTRNISIKFRMNEAEHAVYQRKLDKSGLTAQEYLWRAALGKPLKEIEPEVLDIIADMYLDLDSYADTLRQIMDQNQVYREKDPEGWANLLDAIETAEKAKENCIKALEGVQDEYRQTRREP